MKKKKTSEKENSKILENFGEKVSSEISYEEHSIWWFVEDRFLGDFFVLVFPNEKEQFVR